MFEAIILWYTCSFRLPPEFVNLVSKNVGSNVYINICRPELDCQICDDYILLKVRDPFISVNSS
jgi:hypothetical protein